jgi:hypothetical protein
MTAANSVAKLKVIRCFTFSMRRENIDVIANSQHSDAKHPITSMSVETHVGR